jgi:hypothetical protein
MPDTEENKVDIDTSGPAMDVDIPEEQDAAEIEKPEVKEESTIRPVVEDTAETEVKVEEQKETPKEEKEKELEQYSDSVQRRIAKLTHKWREAQRQADEAAEFARAQIKLKEKAEAKVSKLEPGFMKSSEDAIKSGLEAAKAALAKAREAGDINAEVEAQALISEYGYKQAKFAETKLAQEELAKQKETQVKTPEINLERQPAAQGTPDPKAEAWANKNSWFGQDTAMTYTAFDLHKKLTEQEGFDPSSDEYYSEIDKRIRLEFPHKFDTNKSETGETTTKPVQTVASAKRSTNTGRKTVRLTPSQVAIAKKLGVPLEEYAKQLKITKEV